MIVRVSKHTSHYSVIDNTGLNDIRLSLKARGLLGYLLTKPDNWEVTVKGIISQVPDGRTVVQSALKEMSKFGYAECKVSRGAHGRLDGKKWVIYERSILQNAKNHPVRPDLSDHRQTGFPSVGFSDHRETPTSVKQHQVSTDLRVNTDTAESTYLRTSRLQKNAGSVDDFSVDNPPQVPAPPPTVLFSNSVWHLSAFNVWHDAFSARIPGITVETSRYYFDRCLTWSNRKSAKSNDWLSVAFKFYNQDFSRSQFITSSKPSRNDNNSENGTPKPDLIRAAQRAKRFVDRNSIPVG